MPERLWNAVPEDLWADEHEHYWRSKSFRLGDIALVKAHPNWRLVRPLWCGSPSRSRALRTNLNGRRSQERRFRFAEQDPAANDPGWSVC